VFSGFKRNLEDGAGEGNHSKPARRKPPSFLLASELGGNSSRAPHQSSGRTLGQRSTKALRNNQGDMVRGPGPHDPFSTVGGLGSTQRNVPSFIRSAAGPGASANSSGTSDFSGRTVNTAMLVSSSARNESYAGTSSGQPQHQAK